MLLLIAFLLNAEPTLKGSMRFHLPEKWILERPQDITVDAKGNVYMLDMEACKVFVWDSNGQPRFSFGQEGGGPGEFWFRMQMGYIAVTDEHILISEARKVHVFSLNGHFLWSFEGLPGRGRIRDLEHLEGNLLLVRGDVHSSFFLATMTYDREGFHEKSRFMTIKGQVFIRNEKGGWDYNPYAARPVVGIDRSRKIIYAAVSTKNEVSAFGFDGKLKRAFQVPMTRDDLEQEEKDNFYRVFRGWATPKDRLVFPKYDSLIDLLIPGDNFLLVGQYRQAGTFKGQILDAELAGTRLKSFHQFVGDLALLSHKKGALFLVKTGEDEDYEFETTRLRLEQLH